MNESATALQPEKEKIGVDCILAAVYFFCMPLSVVRLFDMSVLKLISYPLGVFFIVTLFIGDRKLKANTVHLIMSIYIVYTISSLFLLRDDSAWLNVRGILETFLIFLLVSTRVYNKKERSFFLFTWAAAGVLSIFLGFFSSIDFGTEGRTSLLIFGGVEDPNQFCGYFILPMLIYLQKILEKGKLPLKLICIIAFLASIAIVVKTGSRGGLVAVLVAVFFYMIYAAKGVKNKLKILLVVSAVSAFFLFVLYPLFPESIRMRLTVNSVVADRGTGRFDIWAAIWRAIFDSDRTVLFGHGVDSTQQILNGLGFFNTVAHNHWLQLWCDQGIIGLLLFFSLMVAGFLRNRKTMLIVSVALLGMAALSMSLTLYANYKAFWNILILSAMNFVITEQSTERGDE